MIRNRWGLVAHLPTLHSGRERIVMAKFWTRFSATLDANDWNRRCRRFGADRYYTVERLLEND